MPNSRFKLQLGLTLALAAIAAPAAAQEGYVLEDAFPYLTFTAPTDITDAADFTRRLFVVEKSGQIWVFPAEHSATPSQKHLFLDISSRVQASGEGGLLGLAFHPGYRLNGVFFVYYVSAKPYRNILARYHVSADPDSADATSEEILIDVPKTYYFHNGGQIRFGADGYLYIAMGDDLTSEHAQDLTDLRGSILRIDVDNPSPPLLYGIPPDNPFAGNASGYREEIYAYGFRNPWRFSFDDATGQLWAADVGEDTYEELDIVEPGRNYGWPFMEGPACYQPAVCDTAGRNLVLPIDWYDHSQGVAIIGGRHYRGVHAPELTGRFIFADYTGGEIWALDYDGTGPPVRSTLLTDAPVLLTFGEGPPPTNELFVGAFDGHIYRLFHPVTAVGDTPPPSPAARLLGNRPNPFNPTTAVRYELPRAARVVIDVLSVTGALVRRIDAGVPGAGAHEAVWDGTSESGTRVASGVYFCRLIVDGVAVDARPMVLLK